MRGAHTAVPTGIDGHPASLTPRRASAGIVAVIATLGAVLAAGAVVIALRGDMPDRGWLALRNGLAVALPIAVGLYAWREATHARFGRLLVLGGFLWAVVALAASSEPLPYSIGRVAGWLSEVAIVYLLLAFPSGRLPGRADRALVLAAALLIGLLYVPTALLVDAVPGAVHVGHLHHRLPGERAEPRRRDARVGERRRDPGARGALDPAPAAGPLAARGPARARDAAACGAR